MKRPNKFRIALIGALSMAALLPIGAASADPQIGVDVNGMPVAFNEAPPMEVNDSVLVPLRGVFEAMGATVNYDADSKTISANKGKSSVILPLGSTVASVNGQSETLMAPAQVVDGTALVPLRFIAESLGAYVEWHSAQNLVTISTPDAHLSQLPPPPGEGQVIGQLTGVYTNTDPQQITIRVDGENTSIPITGSTVILRSQPGVPGTQVALSDIRIGDQVTVQRDENGNASSITATYGELRGTVKSIGQTASGADVITLNDGTSVQLASDARVRMNGRRITVADVQTDERVLIRTNPENSLAYEILVNPGNGPDGQPAADLGGSSPVNAVGAGPTVTSFDISPNHPLRAGEQVHARLVGAPGCAAVMTIPGVADQIAMQETSPGVYTADVVVPDNIAVDGAAALAQLSIGGYTSPLIEASERVTVASIPPKVISFSPAQGVTVDSDHPLIYATLSDAGGIGINTQSTQVTIDGQNVTGNATVTPTYVDVQPPFALAPGEHQVHVALIDNAGNETNADWQFRVGRNPLIDSFSMDVPSGAILSAGSVVHFSLQAPPAGVASVSIPGLARDIPLRERSPGFYAGSLMIQAGQDATEAPVVARFTAADGRESTMSLSMGLNVAAGAPDAPIITNPVEGASVRGALAIAGTAQPNSTVRVKVDYRSALVGGLLGVSGSAGTREVVADSDGNWSVNDLPVNTDNPLVSGRDTQYTVTAVAIDPGGTESPASQVTVVGAQHIYAHRTGQGE